MNTTLNEIYALISILLIVIILLFGFGLWLASKAANTIFTTLNNKINTLENITFERLTLIEEQTKKINEMDETILSLIEQNKLFDKIHYNIVYDINNIEKNIKTLLDDTSTQIKKLKNKIVSSNKQIKNTHATSILEEQTKIDELKNQIIELSTNISLTGDKITNVENTMVTNEELDDTFNTLTRYLVQHGCTMEYINARMWLNRNLDNRYNILTGVLVTDVRPVFLIRYNKQFYKQELKPPRLNAPVYNVVYDVTTEHCLGHLIYKYESIAGITASDNIGVMEGKVIKFGTVLDRVI
jgi:hypothetical protein